MQVDSSSAHISHNHEERRTAKVRLKPWVRKNTGVVEYMWKTSVPKSLAGKATPHKETRDTLSFLFETQKYISRIYQPITLSNIKRQKFNSEFHTLTQPSTLPASPKVVRKAARARTVLVKSGKRTHTVMIPTPVLLSPSLIESPKVAVTRVQTPSRPTHTRCYRSFESQQKSDSYTITNISLKAFEVEPAEYVVNQYALPQALPRPSPQPSRPPSPRRLENLRISEYLHRFERAPEQPKIRISYGLPGWKIKRPRSMIASRTLLPQKSESLLSLEDLK